jgi:hypothetical protein
MDDHKEDVNTSKATVAFLASTGLLGALAAGYMSIANDARVAINIAEQHDQEMLEIRGDIRSLRMEIINRTDQRYTQTDHQAYDRYIEQRLGEIEKDLEALTK